MTTVVEGPGLQTIRLNMEKPRKDDNDDSRNWMIGDLGRSKIRRYREFISFHFSMLPLCYRYIIIYAYSTQIMLIQRRSVMLFHAHQFFLPPQRIGTV